jgi:transposase-like protein
LIEAKLTSLIGADRYECTATRTTERNGHRSRVLSTNKELKHPCRVVSIFPDEATVIRLGGAVLFDIHDE